MALCRAPPVCSTIPERTQGPHLSREPSKEAWRSIVRRDGGANWRRSTGRAGGPVACSREPCREAVAVRLFPRAIQGGMCVAGSAGVDTQMSTGVK